jgi:hypothetical protein
VPYVGNGGDGCPLEGEPKGGGICWDGDMDSARALTLEIPSVYHPESCIRGCGKEQIPLRSIDQELLYFQHNCGLLGRRDWHLNHPELSQ